MQSENITIIMIIFLNKKLSASTLDFYVANRLKQWYNFKEDLLVAVFFLSVLYHLTPSWDWNSEYTHDSTPITRLETTKETSSCI